MRKPLALLFAFAIFIANTIPAFAAENLQWQTNYEQAVNESRKHSKPMVLFFTGTGWCGWCVKLEKESLGTPEFAQLAGGQFIFVKLDFPSGGGQQSAEEKVQNQQLKKQFGVSGFPTLVILDSKQQQIAVTGYLAGGGKKYAEHLLRMIKEYTSYRDKLDQLESPALSANDLKSLYEKAREFRLEQDASEIIKVGLNNDPDHFFHLEQYRILASKGQIQEEEAGTLKQRLLSSDPQNEKKLHFQVAVIEFQAAASKAEKLHTPKHLTVEPLLVYIQKFGEQDKENLWRLEMIVSQVYQDNHLFNEAQYHAEAAYQAAPSTMQADIALAIQNTKRQLDTDTSIADDEKDLPSDRL